MKDRMKTYSFWVALSGAIVVLVQAVGRLVGFVANADIISNIVMAIAGVLVVLGIVSSPIEKELNKTEDETEKDSKNSKKDKN